MTARAPDTLPVAFPSHHPRALTGQLELSLFQAVWSGAPRPHRVSRVLEVMFDEISGQPVTPKRMRHLNSSARAWLLQKAALRVWPDTGWFQARCAECGENYDLPVRLADAPRKAANAPFPVIEVQTSLGPRRFEAPNGGHEEALALMSSEQDPARQLLALCGLSDRAKAEAAVFTPQDVQRIEAAFEACCPDVADQVDSHCPACKAAVAAQIDPLSFAFPRPQSLLREVHEIAAAYHWPEADILSLPSARRAAYVSLIRESGKKGGAR